jgi:invasion protein IalB
MTRLARTVNLTALAGCLTALTFATAVAQQATPPKQPSPAVQQFGPRVKQSARPAAQPAAQVVATHGDWVIQCEQQPASASGATAEPARGPAPGAGEAAAADAQQPSQTGRTCGMVQTARHEKRQNVGLTLILVRGEQQGKEVTMMRVMAPIGVFLPTGVALEIDGEAVGRVPFTRCMPQACMAFAEASAPTLEKLKKGAKANFIIYEAPGVGISLPVSLKGFTAALAELADL